MLAAIRAGVERDEFATLYAEHRDAMVRLAFLLTSDTGRAEELVADAFIRVWSAWREGQVRDVRAYLRRAVVNASHSRLRRQYVERWHARRVDGDGRGIVQHDEQVAARDELWQAITRLPTRQREVIVLRFYEDLDVATTADLLGVTEGTVTSQSSKALDRLGMMLEVGR